MSLKGYKEQTLLHIYLQELRENSRIGRKKDVCGHTYSETIVDLTLLDTNCAIYEKKMFANSQPITTWDVHFSVWYDFIKKQICPFRFNNHKMLSHLKLSFERRLIAVGVSFHNCGILLGIPKFQLGHIRSHNAFRHMWRYHKLSVSEFILDKFGGSFFALH